jgi:hypothetical protein
VGVLERVPDLLGVTDLDLDCVLVLLGLLLGVWVLLGVCVAVLEVVEQDVLEGDDPVLDERVGVLLKDDVMDAVGERVYDPVFDAEGVLEGETDLLGVTDLDLDCVLVLLGLLLGVWVLLGVCVAVLEVVGEDVLEGEDPVLDERVGVLLKDGVMDAVGERVYEPVFDAEGVLEGDTDLLGVTDLDLERLAVLEGVTLGVIDLLDVFVVLGVRVLLGVWVTEGVRLLLGV